MTDNTTKLIDAYEKAIEVQGRENERLRAALRSVLTMMKAGSTISSEVRVIRIIEKALGDE